ncbi:MFS general substrate transporter, partial [Fragilariopsis cylindrus CCMP1102]
RLLILIRILFFTYYASLGSLLPYLPVYYHSLGHGGQIIGMLGAIKPFTTFLVAPLWGVISDQSGSPFRVLYFTFLISLVGQLLVSWRHDPSWIMYMVFITALFNAPVKSLLDSMVMANIKNSKLYGRLRLWGQLGFGVGSSVVGIILSKSQQAQQQQQDSSLGDTTATVAAAIAILFHNSDALLFFFLVLVVGISSGVIENFAYVRIREVGGGGREMGLSRLVSSMAGAPMFWFSGPLTELLGADRVLAFSLINYVVRYFNYAFMKTPLQGLPAEALRGATFAAFWSTCTIYASRIAPPGMQATMLMLLNAMYGGLGQSLGAIIGGKMQSKYGTVKTFIYAGIIDAVFVVMLIAYLSVRKDSSF